MSALTRRACGSTPALPGRSCASALHSDDPRGGCSTFAPRCSTWIAHEASGAGRPRIDLGLRRRPPSYCTGEGNWLLLTCLCHSGDELSPDQLTKQGPSYGHLNQALRPSLEDPRRGFAVYDRARAACSTHRRPRLNESRAWSPLNLSGAQLDDARSRARRRARRRISSRLPTVSSRVSGLTARRQAVL